MRWMDANGLFLMRLEKKRHLEFYDLVDWRKTCCRMSLSYWVRKFLTFLLFVQVIYVYKRVDTHCIVHRMYTQHSHNRVGWLIWSVCGIYIVLRHIRNSLNVLLHLCFTATAATNSRHKWKTLLHARTHIHTLFDCFTSIYIYKSFWFEHYGLFEVVFSAILMNEIECVQIFELYYSTCTVYMLVYVRW